MTKEKILSAVVGFLLIVVSVFFLVLARRLPSVNPYGAANAGFWPTILLSILACLSLALTISSLRKARPESTERDSQPVGKVNRRQLFLTSLAILCWPFLMVSIGFILSTPIVFGFIMYVFGERRKLSLLTIPLFVTSASYLIFVQFLSISFPRGTGAFWHFSLLFY